MPNENEGPLFKSMIVAPYHDQPPKKIRALFDAINAQNEKQVTKLLTTVTTRQLNRRYYVRNDYQSETPLERAAEVGHLVAVRMLVERGARNCVIAMKKSIVICDFSSALYCAVEGGHSLVVKYLLEQGAEPVTGKFNFCRAKYAEYSCYRADSPLYLTKTISPLYAAIKKGSLENVNLLLNACGSASEAWKLHFARGINSGTREKYVTLNYEVIKSIKGYLPWNNDGIVTILDLILSENFGAFVATKLSTTITLEMAFEEDRADIFERLIQAGIRTLYGQSLTLYHPPDIKFLAKEAAEAGNLNILKWIASKVQAHNRDAAETEVIDTAFIDKAFHDMALRQLLGRQFVGKREPRLVRKPFINCEECLKYIQVDALIRPLSEISRGEEVRQQHITLIRHLVKKGFNPYSTNQAGVTFIDRVKLNIQEYQNEAQRISENIVISHAALLLEQIHIELDLYTKLLDFLIDSSKSPQHDAPLGIVKQ